MKKAVCAKVEKQTWEEFKAFVYNFGGDNRQIGHHLQRALIDYMRHLPDGLARTQKVTRTAAGRIDKLTGFLRNHCHLEAVTDIDIWDAVRELKIGEDWRTFWKYRHLLLIERILVDPTLTKQHMVRVTTVGKKQSVPVFQYGWGPQKTLEDS